jgi:RimJ/RimL family protein N-acetyltransferase
MKVVLREYNESDLIHIESWWKSEHCQENMSRYLPGKFNENKNEWIMYIINVDEIEIGSVWIEYNDDNKQYDLGIMIGVADYLGKEIGKQAIKSIIKEAENKFKIDRLYLNVRQNNQRAINCYKSIGFKIIDEFEKKHESNKDLLKAYRMELKIE